MDEQPTHISWVLEEVIGFEAQVVLSSPSYEESDASKLITYKECLDALKCYRFRIKDFYANGFSSYYGEAYYKVFYEEVLIDEGDSFGVEAESMKFGVGCSSASVSLSSPLSSFTFSDVVRSSPTLNSTTSLSPSNVPPIFIGSSWNGTELHDGRIRYPARTNRNVKRFTREMLPDCSEDFRTGCIGFPSTLPLYTPPWAGKKHFTAPTCIQFESCEMGLPMSTPTFLFPSEINENTMFSFDEIYDVAKTISCLAVGDLNDDGFLDIVVGYGDVVNYPNHTSSEENEVWINLGNNTYMKSKLPGGALVTESIVLGDLDGNRDLDVVIGNADGPNQVIFNFKGEFSDIIIELPDSNENHYTSSIVLGDMDANGTLDIVIANREGLQNSILLNSGDGISYTLVQLPGQNTASIALGDIDRDGNIDIVFGNYGLPNTILFNNGDVSFYQTIIDNDSNANTFTVELGDIDGDGWLDLVIGNDDKSADILYENNRNRAFNKKILPGGATDTRGIALGDINGDGRLDIVITKLSQIILLQNNGENFESVDYLPSNEALVAKCVVLGDMNNDGLLDILTGYVDGAILFQMNSVPGGYRVENLPFRDYNDMESFEPVAVVLEDMNGDGHMDIIIGSTENILIHYGRSFAPIPLDDSGSHVIAVGDLNGDNLTDIVVGSEGPGQLLMSTGSKDNKTMHDYARGELSRSFDNVMAIALGDLDGDGQVDIVGVDQNGKGAILLNGGEGSFNEIISLDNGNDYSTAVALGDLDRNGKLDIVFGSYEHNTVLMNNGNNMFNVTTLPTKQYFEKTSIALGDLDNDGFLDIVIANDNGGNQVFINDRQGNFTLYDLPKLISPTGKISITTSITLGDMDGNGALDIVVGNANNKNYVLLNPGGTFIGTNVITVFLPDGQLDFKQEPLRTQNIALGDLDEDGNIEIIIANRNSNSQVVYYSSCPYAGAPLHGKSWCFPCPTFMGRPAFLNHEISSCLECMPDYLQQTGAGEQCSPYPCANKERRLGETTCKSCGAGNYYDASIKRFEENPRSWQTSRCVECPTGTYANSSVSQTAVNQCMQCNAGEHQPERGQASCISCPPGQYQPSKGQANCTACLLGGYCDSKNTCGGGFTACLPGTYNDKYGMNDIEDCVKCPMGTFSTIPEAKSSEVCENCSPGKFGNDTGLTTCLSCPKGTYQDKEASSNCIVCDAGSYANKIGLDACIPCPYRLSSAKGSNICSICAPNFYLKKVDAGKDEIFTQPEKFCISCPTTTNCSYNTTIQNLHVPKDYWRASFESSRLYRCNNEVCRGSDDSRTPKLNSGQIGFYCEDGHIGPRCEVCNGSQYFSKSKGRCNECPSPTKLLIPFILVIVVTATMLVLHIISIHYFGDFVEKVKVHFADMGAQAKFKILISFYQVATVLRPVYGVDIDPKFQGWFNFLDYFNFGFMELAGFPDRCIGSMTSRLVIGAVWPFFVMFFGFLGIVIHLSLQCFREKGADTKQSPGSFMRKIGYRSLYFITVFIYIVLPGVSRGIFNALKCESFEASDDPNIDSFSYLISDLTIECKRDSGTEFQSIVNTFWILFCLWPLLMPLGLFALLWKVEGAVRSKRTTDLAEACSFLWRDYNESMIFWEIVELYRKIFLTGLILFDIENGSSRVLRLLIAILVSMMYFGVLSRARPFKRRNDLDLAFISNVLLLCCFILGIGLHFCQPGGEFICERYIGLLADSYEMTLFTIILTAIMLAVTVLSLLFIAIKSISTPTVRLVSSGSKPNLEMPSDCNFHAFLSHVWSTGQDRTHTVVRKLQLLMPGVRIWLDVDQLSNIKELEKAIEGCVVVFIFYTAKYFRSKNCRREVYAAVSLGKPIYVIYSGDESLIDEMRDECRKYCKDGEDIIKSILAKDPIHWLGGSNAHFAIESVKVLSQCILSHLPFYQRVPGQLEKGLSIYGELGPVDIISSPCILFCAANSDARRIAEEARSSIEHGNLIHILDVESVIADKFVNDDEEIEQENKVLFLYLNEDIFLDDDGEVSLLVQKAIDYGIRVVCIHECDIRCGGQDFDVFFSQTPQILISPPYQLFKNIAVPLYRLDMYRKVSLRKLLIQIGATETTKEHISSNGVTASLLLKNSMRNSIRKMQNSVRPNSEIFKRFRQSAS